VSRFAKYAWSVLAFNFAVILWGAYVRATQSGAGCGSHWPLCNGVVIPVAPAVETLVEYAHRLSSGLSLLLVVGLFVWAFRAYPKRGHVRLGASLSMLFIVTEALVGAGLVLFQWVARDESLGRVLAIPVHLANTFLLLASLTLTAWWASGGKRLVLKGQGPALWGLGLGLLGVLILGMTGAVTALGDTLFPSTSLGEALQQDFSSTAHILTRLRIWHPVIAISVGFYLLFLAGLLAMLHSGSQVRRPAIMLGVLFICQLFAGLVNVLLLAPVWMQLIHLFLADLVWISLVLLAAGRLSLEPEELSQHVTDAIREPASQADNISRV
jgi:heme A synthase